MTLKKHGLKRRPFRTLMSNKECDKIFDSCDRNKDGKIDFD